MHLLSIADLTGDRIHCILNKAVEMKAEVRAGIFADVLKNKVLALVFHKPSLRTRVSFEVGMSQLGGRSVYITDQEIGIGARESIGDVARVLSRYVDGIMIRTFSHQIAVDLARAASVPVINGLTDLLHPCQILSDLLTIQEKRGDLEFLKVVYIGDGNNVANSWLNAASVLPMSLTICTVKGQEPDKKIAANAKAFAGSKVEVIYDPAEAVRDADVIYTDVWTSMGQEKERGKRRKGMTSLQVNGALLRKAPEDVIVMHCLPAHRGEEITDEVIDGPNSVVLDQAENRMHLQKAILTGLIH
ncbi:MAG: ornithine carbamoyltransferase [Candidatus Eisenbacteria sp.]|nr:ornithine carbamoyltransferase [Candidatus Eisenbacteria bacterium]